MNENGNNLIFLISQPRAGSTMLQRILGGHSAIHTTAEPWVMLHACYGLRNEGYWAEYEAGGWAKKTRNRFIDAIGGRYMHVQAVREFGTAIYRQALSKSDARFFLDKTPRYYYIINELREVFPEAFIVLLLRNPLSVLCSIVRTWVEGRWHRMPFYRDDLLKAPVLLNKIRGLDDAHVHEIRYEDLVRAPETCLRRLCGNIGLPFEPEMITYGRSPSPEFALGDPVNVYKHKTPVPDYVDKWEGYLQNPQIWRLVSDYLGYLKDEIPDLLGYDFADLYEVVQRNQPGLIKRLRTSSLKEALQSKQRVGGSV